MMFLVIEIITLDITPNFFYLLLLFKVFVAVVVNEIHNINDN